MDKDNNRLLSIVNQLNKESQKYEKTKGEIVELQQLIQENTLISDAVARNNEKILGIPYKVLSNKEIVNLIANVELHDNNKFKQISELILSENRYIQTLSTIINQIIEVSTLSYDHIAKNIKTIADVDRFVNQNIKDTNDLSSSLKRLMQCQLRRTVEDRNQIAKIEERLNAEEMQVRNITELLHRIQAFEVDNIIRTTNQWKAHMQEEKQWLHNEINKQKRCNKLSILLCIISLIVISVLSVIIIS